MSKHLGLGVMISQLGGNRESAETFSAALGKRITGATLSDDTLALRFEDGSGIGFFEDGSGIGFFDDGQSCCEARYLKTDDDLTRIIGATLVSAELRDAPNLPLEWGDHEVQFLDVQTSAGLVQVCAHNEHNGYYGGFSIRVKPLATSTRET